MKPRIHIIGGPGSGKSHIAAKLAERFGVPACDLDDLFWDATASHYGVRADAAERDCQLAAIVSQDGWIIEGVYYQWLAPSFDAADFIVVLTPSIWVRHWRVLRRFLLRKFGRIPSKRESLADLWHLLRWSHAYDEDNLIRARKFIAERGRKLITCQTLDEIFAATETNDTAPEPTATAPWVLDWRSMLVVRPILQFFTLSPQSESKHAPHSLLSG